MMNDRFTRNPAMVARVTGHLFLIRRVASTKHWKVFRELLEARIVLLVLAVVSALMLRSEVAAQTLTILHKFTGTNDGSQPTFSLIESSNTLYGTTVGGTVFKVNTDGTGFTTLHVFNCSDGAAPMAPLILFSNTLYGTTDGECSSGGSGTVFAINPDGTGFTNLHAFGSGEGGGPRGAMALSGDVLYGTTFFGGDSGDGTIFRINTDGTDFTTLYNFYYNEYSQVFGGRAPSAGLILSADRFYGITQQGGANDNGTVFVSSTDGTINTLYSFTGGSDGLYPQGGLVLASNKLYGTTSQVDGTGQILGFGTIFSLNTDGTGYTTLHTFATSTSTLSDNPNPRCINSDGAFPWSSLIISGNTLYGTTYSGGSSGSGTVFKINTDGTGFATLYTFSALSGPLGTNSEGANPEGGVILCGNTLFGTTSAGGPSGFGTIFSILLSGLIPQVRIAAAQRNLTLTWPSTSGLILQSTTNLFSPVWTTNLPAPVVVNGQNTVTNPISGSQQFFRLSQ